MLWRARRHHARTTRSKPIRSTPSRSTATKREGGRPPHVRGGRRPLPHLSVLTTVTGIFGLACAREEQGEHRPRALARNPELASFGRGKRARQRGGDSVSDARARAASEGVVGCTRDARALVLDVEGKPLPRLADRDADGARAVAKRIVEENVEDLTNHGARDRRHPTARGAYDDLRPAIEGRPAGRPATRITQPFDSVKLCDDRRGRRNRSAAR
jgi:hypothetical protein